MEEKLVSQFRQIKNLLIVIVALLALQFVPWQGFKDFVGKTIFYVAALYFALKGLQWLVREKCEERLDRFR